MKRLLIFLVLASVLFVTCQMSTMSSPNVHASEAVKHDSLRIDKLKDVFYIGINVEAAPGTVLKIATDKYELGL